MTSWKQGKWGKKDKSTTCSTEDASPTLRGQWGQRSALKPAIQVEMGLKWLLQCCLMVMPTVTKQLLLVWFISTNTPTERSRARTASAGAIRQCRLKYQEYSGCWWIPLTNNWVGGEKMWSLITLFSFDCHLFRWLLLPHFSTLSWSSLLMRHGIHDKL